MALNITGKEAKKRMKMKPYRRKDIKNIPGKLCISKGVVVFNEATLETGLVGNVPASVFQSRSE